MPLQPSRSGTDRPAPHSVPAGNPSASVKTQTALMGIESRSHNRQFGCSVQYCNDPNRHLERVHREISALPKIIQPRPARK